MLIDPFLYLTAKAVQTAPSLSLLSEVVPQTVTLANARQRRLDRETDPSPQDPMQKMLNHVTDQIRRAGKSFAGGAIISGSSHSGNGGVGNSHGKGSAMSRMGSNPGGMPSPFTPLLHHPGGPTPPPRTISPREARALSTGNNKKTSPNAGGANANSRPLAPMPLGSKLPPMGAIPVMGPGGAMAVHVGPMGNIIPGPPPGFDYRNMPMAFAPAPLPPGATVDPEMYRNGIRWAPVQAGAANGGSKSEGENGNANGNGGAGNPMTHPLNMPPGMWAEIPHGQYRMQPPPPSSNTTTASTTQPWDSKQKSKTTQQKKEQQQSKKKEQDQEGIGNSGVASASSQAKTNRRSSSSSVMSTSNTTTPSTNTNNATSTSTSNNKSDINNGNSSVVATPAAASSSTSTPAPKTNARSRKKPSMGGASANRDAVVDSSDDTKMESSATAEVDSKSGSTAAPRGSDSKATPSSSSMFQPDRLQGRTIYSASDSKAAASNAEPKEKETGKSSSPKKETPSRRSKRTSMRKGGEDADS
jgi:hypothetical protein